MRELDKYELDIEDNFDQQESIADFKDQFKVFKGAAAEHLKKKKVISIRIAANDLEAIKIKASKMGLAYQTYINSILHQVASKL